MTTLAEQLPGTRWRVVEVHGHDALAQRLMEMGLIAGTDVTVIGHAPLGDPMHVALLGYELALRLSEARRVEVTA
jgi:Fe2+ transport system protein FeoA